MMMQQDASAAAPVAADGAELKAGKVTHKDGSWDAGYLDAENRVQGVGVRMVIPGREWYEGEFKDGVPHGHGTWHHQSGLVTCGEFKDSKVHGMARREFPSGDVFSGEFRDGKSSGRGTYKFANGDVFEGEFAEDGASGRGIKQFASGMRYTGEFVKDAMTGRGLLQYSNGDVYKGEFEDNMMSGKGLYQFENGDYCMGAFKSDAMDGPGELFFANGDKYVGDFKNDEPCGKGIYIWSPGADGVAAETYEGQFENSLMQPRGRRTFRDGSSWTGSFRDGKPNGEGIFKFGPSGPDAEREVKCTYKLGMLQDAEAIVASAPAVPRQVAGTHAMGGGGPATPAPTDDATKEEAMGVDALMSF
ncbi:Phosphatidylinositol 4-phosphate 5-kinase 1 [Hondaea fermentalgiana]|uniref:Phosphatidylinositol 4-phosphate 5-kinase 1 n=1 Tax=Hondaea fermentalgiana TaxID=2315210 RepID=A0A2R5GBS7_9STRA|nr:Phosphatidylinositol 4-phosphate 5-kinase 1 [Hondaea fermentalgiana]|eukprot:GBG25194.1 Phosphatidylinositol 4-phosphate 5-kinase 1 [Hondaea fermentalgiana]